MHFSIQYLFLCELADFDSFARCDSFFNWRVNYYWLNGQASCIELQLSYFDFVA